METVVTKISITTNKKHESSICYIFVHLIISQIMALERKQCILSDSHVSHSNDRVRPILLENLLNLIEYF